MKPSGIEWIGEIPEDWTLERIKTVADYVSRGNSPTYDEEGTIKVVNQSCVQNGFMEFSKVKYNVDEDISAFKGKLQKNDLLINSTGTGTLGRVAVYQADETDVIADGHVTIVRNRFESFDPFYLNYFFFDKQALLSEAYALGATNQIELQREKFRSMFVPMPSVNEQKAIAAFLDDKTTQIDQAIRAKESQLTTLDELKKSLIHRTVTKGLDHTAAMKPSGIEWIGEIPANWEIERLKDVTFINHKSLSSSTQDEYELQYIEISNVNSTGIISKESIETVNFIDAPSRARRCITYGDTIISSVRPNLQAIACIDSEDDNLVCSTGFNTVKPIYTQNVDNKFIYYLLLSDYGKQYFVMCGKGVGYPAVDDKDFGSFHIPVPPAHEQKAIAAFLDTECAKIDAQKATVTRQIELLREYKKSLIYEYVTGKRRVAA